MIFSETWQNVINETKNQTYRICKALENPIYKGSVSIKGFSMQSNERGHLDITLPDEVQTSRYIDRVLSEYRTIYRVGASYSVQTGRGYRAIYWRDTPQGRETNYDPALIEYERAKVPYLISMGFKQARIEIIEIAQQDVRTITPEQIRAEGFRDKAEFMIVWCAFHDRALELSWYDCFRWKLNGRYYEGYEEFYDVLNNRVASRYKAWRLKFKLIK